MTTTMTPSDWLQLAGHFASLSLLGFTFQGERGEPILRAEYVYLDGKVYGLRSSPV